MLIVEDHEENRNLLKMLLEANGYRVTAAGDGLEALAAARRDRPDAIVSDVLMPKMDGFAPVPRLDAGYGARSIYRSFSTLPLMCARTTSSSPWRWARCAI